jgi:hypothetical protein
MTTASNRNGLKAKLWCENQVTKSERRAKSSNIVGNVCLRQAEKNEKILQMT